MRTRIFSVPSSGTPTAAWQSGNATTGQAGALLPFTTSAGQSAGSAGTFQGPGSYISAQFSMATKPASLYVALDTNGSTSDVTINLESYSNFAWIVLDSSALGAPSSTAVNLPVASQLGLLRLRVSISGNASATYVAILNTTAAAQGGGGGGSNNATGDWDYRKDLKGAIGGAATDLDSVSTADLDFGHVIAFNFAGQLAAYRYEDPNDPDTPVLPSQPTGPGSNGTLSRFRSLDQDAQSNDGIWVRIL